MVGVKLVYVSWRFDLMDWLMTEEPTLTLLQLVSVIRAIKLIIDVF